MTIEEFIRARLDEDEQIARAAAARAAEWRSEGGHVAGGPFEPRPEWLDADDAWTVAESATHTIVYDEGWPLKPEAAHIALHDPARVLRQVEAIRLVADVYETETKRIQATDPTARAYGDGYHAACRWIIRILASIYPEDTDETEEP